MNSKDAFVGFKINKNKFVPISDQNFKWEAKKKNLLDAHKQHEPVAWLSLS